MVYHPSIVSVISGKDFLFDVFKVFFYFLASNFVIFPIKVCIWVKKDIGLIDTR